MIIKKNEIIRYRRHIIFGIILLALLMLYLPNYYSLFSFSLNSAVYSHIVLIPVIVIFFLLREIMHIRNKIMVNSDITIGILVMFSGSILGMIGLVFSNTMSENDLLALNTLSSLIVMGGVVVVFYGLNFLKQIKFPVLFSVFMIPIPDFLYSIIISLLQSGSALVTFLILQLSGTPFFREGLTFYLEQLSIRIAPECSGIRSSLALIILSVMTAHLFLPTLKNKILFCLIVLPFTVIKNGIRISSLTLLGIYVDNGYITDSLLHSRGGIVFFLLTLLLVLPIFLFFRNIGNENKQCKVFRQ